MFAHESPGRQIDEAGARNLRIEGPVEGRELFHLGNSGLLESPDKEPIGASGLRQIHELVRQLRGGAGDRQVAGEPRVGFAQLYGAPGTAAATIVTL